MSSKNRSLHQSLKPVYYVFKTLGLAPYSFDWKPKSFRISCLNQIQLIVNLGVWTFSIWYQSDKLDHFTQDTGVQSVLLENLWKYQYVVQRCFAPVVIVFNFVNRKHVKNTMNKLSLFDAVFGCLSWGGKARLSYVLTMLILFSPLFFVTIQVIIAWSSDIYGAVSVYNFPALLGFAEYILVTGFYFALSFQFILSVYCVNSRLKALTKNIQEFLPLSDDNVLAVRMHPMKQRHVIENARILYDTLADAVDEINSVFSIEMIFVFIPALMLEVFTTYFAVKAIFKNLSIPGWTYSDFTMWNLFLTVPSLVAIIVGQQSINISQALKAHIEKCSNCCSDETIQRMLNSFIRKLNTRSMQFTCQLFNIDWTLGLSILGTITTYMIIICQFENDA